VLVVEDEAIIAFDLEMQIEDLGHESVGVAPNIATALALAEATRPDIALIDLTLAQGDDGRWVARRLRDLLQIPCIILSGSLHRLTREDIAAIAPLALLSKPLSPRTLTMTFAQLEPQLRAA
jgi:CheY-like chemotaxis protein